MAKLERRDRRAGVRARSARRARHRGRGADRRPGAARASWRRGDLTDTARQQGDPFSGTLRLGVIPTVCPYCCRKSRRPAQDELPNLHVIWSEEKTQPLVDRIDEAPRSTARSSRSMTTWRGLEHAPLGDDPFVLAAAPGHAPDETPGPASTDLLDGATVFLLDDGHCFRDQALALCGAQGRERADLNATGLSTLVQMVGGGDGVTLLPALAVRGGESTRSARGARVPSAAPDANDGAGVAQGAAMQRPLGAVAGAIREGLAEVGVCNGV